MASDSHRWSPCRRFPTRQPHQRVTPLLTQKMDTLSQVLCDGSPPDQGKEMAAYVSFHLSKEI